MKIAKKHFKVFFLIFFFLFGQIWGILVFANQAFATSTLWDSQLGLGGEEEGVIGKEGFSKTAVETQDIRTVVASLIEVVLGFLGIICVILMIYAGFKWMTSRGDENAISEAKGTISAATIGLVIIMASYAITAMVINYIYNATP